MQKKLNCFLIAAGLLLTFTVTTLGQVTGGAVTGTVLDATGAVVPNATVSLKSKTTGQELTTQTTGSGSYSYPNVAVGDYTITAVSTGFQTVNQDLRVSLNQTTSVDVTLQAGSIAAETVEVTAASEALVQTNSSQLGKSFETRLVQNLPTFGNQNALALLSPNVVDRSSGVLGSGGSVGGTRARSNVFTVDGVENNDPSVTGPATGVIQDAVQEFTLLTNNFNAEFGQGGGGQFVTTTRTGTNEFHGSGFVYGQHQQLNAASTAEERQLQSGEIAEKPRDRNTRFGLTFGGPFVKNNLFFFGAFERNQVAAEGSSATFEAPTSAGLGQIAGLSGVSPFVLNLLQSNLSLAPTQTTTRTVLGTSGIPFGDVSLNIPSGSDTNAYQFNVDHLRGAKDQFRYRLSYSNFASEGAGLGSPNFNNLSVYNTRLFSATWVRTINSNLVNDLRLAYRRAISDSPLKDPTNLTFPNITVRPLNLQLGPVSNLPQSGGDNIYQVFDTVSYIRGAHNFKFGGEFRRLLTTSNFLARQRGDYIYNTFDDLLRDITPSGRDALRGVGNGTFTGNQSKFYVFGQDDWKVTPNLTLNLGLRYEYVTLPRAITDFIPFFNGVSVPGLDFENVENDKNNFAPRVGFAYAPSSESGFLRTLFGERGQSSIRGNFTVSYSEVFQNLNLFAKPPQLEQELAVEQLIAANPSFNTGTGFLQRGGLPATQLPFTGGAERVRAFIGGINNTESFVLPYTMAFALSMQRELTRSMAVEVRYLGTRTRKLPVQVPLNLGLTPAEALTIPTFFSQPTAAQLTGLPTLATVRTRPGVRVQPYADEGFFGGVTAFPPIGNSQYDSASVSVTRRFTQGFAFTSAYTWSKTIDDSTNELFSSVVNPRRPQNFNNLSDERSLSALDIPHRFVFAANFELPFFRNSSNGFLKGVLGGFELAPIFSTQSGQPFTPLSGVDSNQNFDAAPDRTILNPSGTPRTGSRVVALNSQGQFLTSTGAVTTNIAAAGVGSTAAVAYLAVNPNAQYIQTGLGARATAGRNTLRGRGFHRTDLTALKNFRFGDDDNQYNLQVGAEFFNLFNQRIRDISTVGPTNTAFVNVFSPRFNDYSLGIVDGRTIQLRAKFIF
ncbi:MAG: TonB-dependent receptor [Acidobacteriota bacterium]|nr:TonB-dependent receptor [Acidobacteriota bacterium]